VRFKAARYVRANIAENAVYINCGVLSGSTGLLTIVTRLIPFVRGRRRHVNRQSGETPLNNSNP
jgi:hypothetical protein